MIDGNVVGQKSQPILTKIQQQKKNSQMTLICCTKNIVTKMLQILQMRFIRILASWFSWLERCPVTAEVTGSNPVEVASGVEQSGSSLDS